MKKILFYLIIVFLIAPVLNARIITIQVGFNGLRVFNPATVTDAQVGDTVQWVWVSGLESFDNFNYYSCRRTCME